MQKASAPSLWSQPSEFPERCRAVEEMIDREVPLCEIETQLDWLDAHKPVRRRQAARSWRGTRRIKAMAHYLFAAWA